MLKRTWRKISCGADWYSRRSNETSEN